jgi:hypothetical protein
MLFDTFANFFCWQTLFQHRNRKSTIVDYTREELTGAERSDGG